MEFKIYHPRILLILLILIGALASGAILLARDGREDVTQTTSVAIPMAPRQSPLTELEKENVAGIVKSSGLVEGINNGQTWEASQFSRTKISGHDGVRLEVTWDNPVESTGPWSVLHCAGTVKTYSTEPWRQITRLVFWVNSETNAVSGYAVTTEPEDDPEADTDAIENDASLKIYDIQTGEIVFEGRVSEAKLSDICVADTYYSH